MSKVWNTPHNRDINAAINLKNYIPTKHWEFTSVETEKILKL